MVAAEDQLGSLHTKTILEFRGIKTRKLLGERMLDRDRETHQGWIITGSYFPLVPLTTIVNACPDNRKPQFSPQNSLYYLVHTPLNDVCTPEVV